MSEKKVGKKHIEKKHDKNLAQDCIHKISGDYGIYSSSETLCKIGINFNVSLNFFIAPSIPYNLLRKSYIIEV